MIAFQRNDFQILKKDIPGLQKIYIRKGQKKKFIIPSFLRDMQYKKGHQGANSQEETCLIFVCVCVCVCVFAQSSLAL